MRHPICVGEGDCFRELVHEVEGDGGVVDSEQSRGDDGSDVETEGVSNRG